MQEGAKWTAATLTSLPADLPQTVSDLRSVLQQHCKRELLKVAKGIVKWSMDTLPIKGTSTGRQKCQSGIYLLRPALETTGHHS